MKKEERSGSEGGEGQSLPDLEVLSHFSLYPQSHRSRGVCEELFPSLLADGTCIQGLTPALTSLSSAHVT